MEYLFYTDGSTKGNGKTESVGAWAYTIVSETNELLGAAAQPIRNTTNQRMELEAAIHACDCALRHYLSDKNNTIVIKSDSAYLINCLTQQWYVNWLSNGWITSKKTPVLNKDLWEKLIPFFNNKQIKWEKCKGHANDEWNNYVDQLAQNTADSIKEN